MISQHNEIEVKIPADKVDIEEFRAFCFGRKPTRYITVSSPDVYWESSEHVVRHRQDRDKPELTVKRRTSTQSTQDRVEVDLDMSTNTVEDVEAWLQFSGFTPALRLVKTAHIFWFEKRKHKVTVVIYDVWKEVDGKKVECKRFIEIEAAKLSDVSPEAAKRNIKAWRDAIELDFDVSEPVNDSLWELYTGKKYLLADTL